jgi:kynureninase
LNTAHQNSLAYAQYLDAHDALKGFRDEFFIPQKNGKPAIYLCGNSLGLQPKKTSAYIQQELDDWKNLGVEGHFEAQNPWLKYHHFFDEAATLVGAKKEEVVVMNTLTVNLHLMMISFFRPKGKRNKIVLEGGAFPSDQYAIESQLQFHGLNYAEHAIELLPSAGEHTLRIENIVATLKQHQDEIALVLLGGVNYYTGQYYDIKTITETAHQIGAIAGFDLAHAAGNVPLQLHQWNVDFAVWCSYKYLNSGPGGPAAIFVHEKHGNNLNTPRLAGWWGYDEATRFQMKPGFIPQPGAAGWQLSNAQIFSMAAHKASLDIFAKTTMQQLRAKSEMLTGFLYFLLAEKIAAGTLDLQIITPENKEERGCQLSLLTNSKGKQLFEKISAQGVIADWREPNVIRVAPVPLYNTFEEVYTFANML